MVSTWYRPMFLGIVAMLICSAAASGQQPTTLPAAERPIYEALKSKKLHELGGQQALADYMRLRKLALGDELPSAAEDIAHYALMAVGQSYERKAWQHDLERSDCVTWTERCIALGCTDNWLAAYKLLGRLRYRAGSGETSDLNREPIFDWIPNNTAWLFDEVTDSVGVPLATFNAHFENRDAQVSYIAKDVLRTAYPQLRTGDLLFVIADSVNPPSDPEMRTRCVHMAIVYKPGGDADVQILHSYPPVASQWPLSRLMGNRYARGGKFLRLKPGARQVVVAELAGMADRFNATPAQVENRSRLRKGEFAFITPPRTPDSTVDIGGIRYGVIQLREGETLWSLFKGGWKGICNLDVNREFMQRHASLNARDYQGDQIRFPISRVNGDTTLP